MRYLVVLLLAGCSEQYQPAKIPDPLPNTFTHYQLYPMSAAYAWRLNVETGDVHLCAAGPQRGICAQLSVEK